MKARFWILVIIYFAFSGCSTDLEEESTELPDSYSYKVTMICYCTPSYIGPHRIKMENDLIVSYEYLGDGEGLAKEEYENLALPVLQMKAEETIAQGPASQMIERHPVYGFIAEAYFDIDERIADEEGGFKIEDFLPE